MLAYVLWHRPAEGADIDRYERHLFSFHEALHAMRSRGFLDSHVYRVTATPWFPSAGYEDWCLLADSSSLDALNTDAVSGDRKSSHDMVAGTTSARLAGLYDSLRGGGEAAGTSPCIWLTKPEGVSLDGFLTDLYCRIPITWGVWRRRMVLAPTPAFCVVASDATPVPALPEEWKPLVVNRQRVWPEMKR